MNEHERAFFQCVFELSDQFVTHDRKARVSARGNLLKDLKIASLFNPRNLLHYYRLIALELLLGVFGGHGDRLKERKTTPLARKPGVNPRNQIARQHEPHSKRPLIAARPRPRANALLAPTLREVPALAGQLEQEVEGLTLALFLGRAELLALLELSQELAGARRQAATLPPSDGLCSYTEQASQGCGAPRLK